MHGSFQFGQGLFGQLGDFTEVPPLELVPEPEPVRATASDDYPLSAYSRRRPKRSRQREDEEIFAVVMSILDSHAVC